MAELTNADRIVLLAAKIEDWPTKCEQVAWDHGDQSLPWVAEPRPHFGTTSDAEIGDLIWEPKMGRGHVLATEAMCGRPGVYCGYCAGMIGDHKITLCECGDYLLEDHHNFLLRKRPKEEPGV